MPNVNKVVLGDKTLLDLTELTVTPGSLLSGYTAHAADGSVITGTKQGTPSTQLTTKTVTANGTYTPPSGYAGFSQVTANVPVSGKIIPSKTITQNGTYAASSDDNTKSGYGRVVVNVPQPGPTKGWFKASDLPYDFKWGKAVVVNNEIHIIGSIISGNGTKHYKWNGSSWIQVSTLPYAFDLGAAVVLNGEIHILGGDDNYTKHYKWNGSSWTSVSTLPYEFTGRPAVVYNNEIYIFGSALIDEHTLLYRKLYKWNGSSWSYVCDLPYMPTSACAVVYNNEIHLMGSYNSTEYKYHYKWSGGSSWTSVSTLPYGFVNGSAAVYDDGIHIFGSGVSGSRTKHYKWNGTSWENYSTLPYQFYWGDAVVCDDTMYILGGGESSTTQRGHYKYVNGISYKTYIDNVLQQRDLDFETVEDSGQAARWDRVSTLPYNLYWGNAVVYNDELHIMGGGFERDEYAMGRYHYKWNGSSWTSVSTLPIGCNLMLSATVFNNMINLIFQDSHGKHHYAWNGSTWLDYTSDLPDYWSTGYVFRPGISIVYNNELHVLGSLSGEDVNNHFIWNGSTWRVGALLPSYGLISSATAEGGNAVVYENTIHVLGILEESGANIGYGHYKLSGSNWTRVSTVPTCLSKQRAVVYDGAIHLFTNVSIDNDDYPKHYTWDGTNWNESDTQPHLFEDGCSVVYNDKINLLGEYDRFNQESTRYHYVYTEGTPAIKLYRLIPPEPDEEGD